MHIHAPKKKKKDRRIVWVSSPRLPCDALRAHKSSAEESFDFMRRFYVIFHRTSLNWIGWHDFYVAHYSTPQEAPNIPEVCWIFLHSLGMAYYLRSAHRTSQHLLPHRRNRMCAVCDCRSDRIFSWWNWLVFFNHNLYLWRGGSWYAVSNTKNVNINSSSKRKPWQTHQ